jgi:NitT/TauT family transport system substrate-binding protein
MSSRHTLRLSALAFALSSAVAVPAPAAESKSISVVLSHATFAVGEDVFVYAVPKALGYFAEEGLDVTLLGAAGGVQGGQVLQSGRAQIGASLAEGILQMREQGATPVAFFTLKQNNGYLVSVPPDSPIKTLADLKGKTIGFPVAGGGTKMIMDESMRLEGVEPTYTPVVIGYGPAAAAAINDKKVDAAVLWDAAYGLMENQGMKFRYIELPIQDKIAGFSLMATEATLKQDPKMVAGYCRAMVKGLVYTLTNKRAAVAAFYKEFPQTVPANTPLETAVDQGVHVLDMWLGRALKGLPADTTFGAIDPAKWAFSGQLYPTYGLLKGTKPVADAYTASFTEPCNAFDRAAVTAQAAAAK